MAAALEGRVRLLVIDNCEHVLDSAADLIEAILAALCDCYESWPPAAKDSESPTNSYGAVPSLDFNCGNDSAAVSLFVERAHSVEPDFSLAHSGETDAVSRHLPQTGRDPFGHRIGRLADGVDDGQRGA